MYIYTAYCNILNLCGGATLAAAAVANKVLKTVFNTDMYKS